MLLKNIKFSKKLCLIFISHLYLSQIIIFIYYHLILSRIISKLIIINRLNLIIYRKKLFKYRFWEQQLLLSSLKKNILRKDKKICWSCSSLFIQYRWDVMNAVDATSINSQNAFDALSKNFAQIKTKLNMKMSKIKELYKLKEKNLSKMMSWTTMKKFFDLMKHATRHECASVTNNK